ncbi:MAG: carboxylesterase/lipase family protein [Steroidobacteraceae bacterium]
MSRSSLWTHGLMLLMAAALMQSAGAAVRRPRAPSPVVTPSGALQGFERGGVVAYLGVPYARPPVGNLRWRPPEALPRWSGVRLATRFGNICMQRRGRRAAGHSPSAAGEHPAPAGPSMSEDCLYLNLWVPTHHGPGELPVMVWVHGGAFLLGSSSQPLYDGANLARRGVIVVTLNYRLGRFGFFAHPALVEKSAQGLFGNYGLLDQLAALRWVERNVAAFGGDPRNVTFFGQSAGGISVLDLLTSPLARGLFERAIIESGAMTGRATTLAQAEAAGEAAARSWGLAHPDAAALRAVPAAEVLGRGPPLAVRAGPIIDGKILPRDVMTAFDAGEIEGAAEPNGRHVPLIIGSNSYEAGFFPGMARGLSTRLSAQWPRVEALFDGYGTHQTADIEGELATDMRITAPTWRVARDAARAGLPTYLYYFAYLRPSERGRQPGPQHIDEVYAVFGHLGLVEKHLDKSTRRIVAELQSRWVRFARTGDPAAAGAPWPRVTPGSMKVLEFAQNGPVVRGDFASRRLALARKLTRELAHEAREAHAAPHGP